MGHVHFHPKMATHTLCAPVPGEEFNFSKKNPLGLPEKQNANVTDKDFNFLDILPPFILADRGGCSFVTKVRNMEDAGAAIGIVIDSSDE